VYAVVQTGGQQHRVMVGQSILVQKLPDVADGDTVELDRVLAIGEEDRTAIGTPIVPGARVLTRVQAAEEKGQKIIVFKYKPKVRYRRKTGHRQRYTRLLVREIVAGS